MSARQQQRGAHRTRGETRARPWVARLLGVCSVLIAIAMLIGVGLLGFYSYRHLDQPLTQVRVGGKFNHLRQQDVVNLVAANIDGGFVGVNLDRLRSKLQEHPWIAEASVRRQWPDTLLVEIQEEIPIARWGERGFLNRQGEELQIDDNSELADLPVLRGAYSNSRQMMQYYQQLSGLFSALGMKVVVLQQDRVGALSAITDSHLQLVLGRDYLVQKVRRLQRVWNAGLDAQQSVIQSIDLRYPNGLTVAWKDKRDDSQKNTSQAKTGRGSSAQEALPGKKYG